MGTDVYKTDVLIIGNSIAGLRAACSAGKVGASVVVVGMGGCFPELWLSTHLWGPMIQRNYILKTPLLRLSYQRSRFGQGLS